MVDLIEINFEEYKELVYPEYLKIFPEEERKELKTIESNYKNKISKFIKITESNQFIGFYMINTVENNKYAQIDYFAILTEYRNKGYGTEAINVIKEKFTQYNGIFIEIDKLGIGESEEESILRQKRANFYERLGFHKLNFDLVWFKTLILSPYILMLNNSKDTEDIILESMFKIYIAAHGKEKVDRKCKVIKIK